MVSILVILAFLIARTYYSDLYKIVFYISTPFVILMVLITASGDLTAAEQIGNIVFLAFILLNLEVVFSKFIDKQAKHVQRATEHTKKKKKR